MIDYKILAYLLKNGTKPHEAKSAEEIEIYLRIIRKRALQKRLVNLKEYNFVSEGLKTSRKKNYYLTDEGEEFLINKAA